MIHDHDDEDLGFRAPHQRIDMVHIGAKYAKKDDDGRGGKLTWVAQKHELYRTDDRLMSAG